MKALLLFSLFASFAFAQTTAISASALKDQQGNLITGTLCLDATPGNSSTVVNCQAVTAGVINSFSIANGTYGIRLNENGQPIFAITATLSGTAIAADTYLQGQYAATVGGAAYYLTNTAAGQLNPIPCNGNSVVLPAQPVANVMIAVINISTSASCTVNGNGNTILYQGASVSPATLTKGLTAEAIFVVNYDGASHNGWLVTHLGN